MTDSIRSAAVFCGLVGVIVLIWLLAIPPSAGPDEPDHMVRAAALVRGQLDGTPADSPGGPTFDLPAWVGFPDPGCFAQQPYTPATCATDQVRPGDQSVPIDTRSADYPIWGHLLPGVGTLLPAGIAGWAARALGALPCVVLLGLALFLRARAGWLAAGGAVLAITPMVWFSIAVVNPSGLAIAGGVALWVALGTSCPSTATLGRWLTAAAWAALVLPRRDGMIWAMLILAIAMLVHSIGLRDTWKRLGVGPQVIVVASTLATLAWAATSDTSSSKALFATPLIPIVAVLARRVWVSPSMAGRVPRAVGSVVVAAVGVVVAYLLMNRRAGGYDGNVMLIVVGRTGVHLREAIGVLGWLDTPIPETMLILWIVGLGLLVAAAVAIDDRARLSGAVATLGAGVAGAWVLEMAQGDPSGTYWQGRYSLPLLVGIPLLLASVRPSVGASAAGARLGRATLLIALVVTNVSLAEAMRRWGVGIAGSLSPFAWDTYDAPIPPVALLVGDLAASVGLWRHIATTAGDAEVVSEATHPVSNTFS